MQCPIFFSNLFLVEQSNIEVSVRQAGNISHLSRCSQPNLNFLRSNSMAITEGSTAGSSGPFWLVEGLCSWKAERFAGILSIPTTDIYALKSAPTDHASSFDQVRGKEQDGWDHSLWSNSCYLKKIPTVNVTMI